MEASLPAILEAPASTPWSKGLGSLLLSDDNDGRADHRRGAIRLIAINPTLRAECQRLLPEFECLKAPATDEDVIAAVARSMPAWGVGTKHAAEWGVTYASYAEALEGMPLYCVEDAIRRWNRGEVHKDLAAAGFPPRPAQLALLAADSRRELLMAAYRAKLAVEHVEQQQAKPRFTEEERARNAEAIKAMLAKPVKHVPPQPPGVSAVEWARRCREEGNLLDQPVPAPRRHATPQEAAQALLREASGVARAGGAPISQRHIDDPGDVV